MQKTIILTTIPSDCHSWNLVFMDMFLKERGHQVINLGICVSYELVLQECRRYKPSLLVVSTVNGHGYMEGVELSRRLGTIKRLFGMRLVIGGKINTDQTQIEVHADILLRAGFDAVYWGPTALTDFEKFLCLELSDQSPMKMSHENVPLGGLIVEGEALLEGDCQVVNY